VLSKQAAKQHLGNVTHKSKSDVPVIFFGTSEIAWVGAKDVASWEEGMRNSYHNKGRKNKKFIVALEQVGMPAPAGCSQGLQCSKWQFWHHHGTVDQP
jgi:hypothetical protein